MLARRRCHPALLFAACFVLLTGCDSVTTGDAIVLFANVDRGDIAPLRFTFAAEDLRTGRLEDLFSTNRIDIGPFLQSNGFAKSEVIGATVQSARLEILFPVTEVTNFLDEAILKFDATGLSVTEVADQGSFSGTADEVDLNIRSGRDVTSFLVANNFGAILQVDANALRAGEDYELAVSLSLRIELEGI